MVAAKFCTRMGLGLLVCAKEPDHYVYMEHGSKNRSGGLAQLNVANKQVAGYATPSNEPRCIVFLLDLYLSKLPKYAFDKDVFYLRPKANDRKFLVCPGMTVSHWGEINILRCICNCAVCSLRSIL